MPIAIPEARPMWIRELLVYRARCQWYPQKLADQAAKCRACMCRVPFAKPGKDSMDLEVFGMAGVPAGAMPGVPVKGYITLA